MPNHPVPAKRYAIFQTAFEKKVAEAQAEIAKLNDLQGLYTVAREALIAVNLDNETRLDMHGLFETVSIRIYLKDGDTMDTFHPLLDEIGNGLVQRKLHSDGLPASNEGLSNIDRQFTWRIGAKRLELRLDVPWNGTDCIEIIKEEKRIDRVETIRRAIWHSAPYRHKRLSHES